MDSGDRILVAAGLTAAVVVGAFVLWGPGGAPRVRKRRGQIAGLQNLGRTCFLNTLLQALAACPELLAWLKRHAQLGGNNSMITTLYTVIEVVNGTHEQARGTAVCPLGVLQCLRAAGWVISAEQQDAHELLHVLLTCIEEETIAMSKKPGCLSDALALGGARAWSALASPATPPGRPPRADSTPPTPAARPAARPARPARPASAAPDLDPDLDDAADAEPEPSPWGLSGGLRGASRSLSTLTSLARRVPAPPARAPPPPPFRGSLASRLQCAACNTKSPVRYDKFDSISLPLSAGGGAGGGYSLAGLLRAFTAPELVKGVRCARCAERDQPAAGAGAAPEGQHIRTVNFGKHTFCPLPLSRAAPAGEPGGAGAAGAGAGAGADARAQFSLVAVVVHVGGPRSGHFATYRRGNGFESKRWWYTSDTLVHEVSLAEVLRCAAYLLFYERRRPERGSALPRLDC